MYQERNHTKSNQPKSVKGARKQVEELEAWLEIERDAIRAASELNNELNMKWTPLLGPVAVRS